MVKITLGSSYAKHYIGVGHTQPHEYHQIPTNVSIFIVLAKTFFCTCEIRKQFYYNFLNSNPKYENKYIYIYIWGVLGGGGALHQTQGYQIFRAVRLHHRADICITREKNKHQFFIYFIMCIFGYLAIWGLFGPQIQFNSIQFIYFRMKIHT